MKITLRTLQSMEQGIEGPSLEGRSFLLQTSDGHSFELSDAANAQYDLSGLCVRTVEGGFSLHPVAFNVGVLINDNESRSPK